MAWWRRGTPKSSSNGIDTLDYDTLVTRAMNELRLKTDAAVGLFGIDEADWSVDQGAGTIIFTLANGLQALAPVQFIGTYNPSDGTWLWAWDNRSIDESLRRHAEAVLRYGKRHGIKELTQKKLTCDEHTSWRLTALACCLNEAQGAYRGPAEGPFMFMTFGTVTLSKGR